MAVASLVVVVVNVMGDAGEPRRSDEDNGAGEKCNMALEINVGESIETVRTRMAVPAFGLSCFVEFARDME